MSVTALPAGLARWYTDNRILAWICLLIFVNQLGFGSIVPAVPLYARSFDVPLWAIGLTIAAYGFARFLVGLPAGLISDRYGRRYALALGGAITVIGNVMCALAPSYLPFLFARFIAGFGAGLVITASQIMLADISTPERRGRIMATYGGVFSFAVGIGPLPGGYLADQFGLSAPFWAYSIMGLGAAIIAWFRVPETRLLRAPAASVTPHGQPPAIKPSFAAQMRILTRQPGFLLISLVGFAGFFSRTGGLFSIIPVLGQERLGLTPDQIGLGLATISVMAVILAYPSGALADKYGRKLMIVPSTIMTGISMLLFLSAPSFFWFMVASFAWSIATGIGSSAPGAYAADITPPGMNAAAMSTFRMISETGYVIGPLALGALADLFGANTALGTTAVFMAVVGILFGVFAPEKSRRPAAIAAT
jgi:DHA1 family multidrug resistance protein-like MFS transporter